MVQVARRERWSVHGIGLGIVIAWPLAGCDYMNETMKQSLGSPDPSAVSPATSAAAPANPDGRTLIEIVKCEAIAESISRYQLSATYRFVSGKPKPSLDYTLDVSFPGCPFNEIKKISGRDLQMEGTIQWSYELPGIGERGESETTEARFQFSEEFERQGNQVGFLGVSRPETVKVDMSRLGF